MVRKDDMHRSTTLSRFAVRRSAVALPLFGLLVCFIAPVCSAQDAGQVKFVNSCKYSLTFNSTGPQIGMLAPGASKTIPISSFNQGGQNRIIPYPNLDDNGVNP